MKKTDHSFYLVLHNLRSAHNVGAIFRTADAAGVSKIIISGYTPVPIDKYNRVNKEIKKTALGAENYLNWKKISNLSNYLKELKNKKFSILALEQSSKSIDYRLAKIKTQTALIVGNEKIGLDRRLLNHCDLVLEIPMKGKKESLNVATAVGIALFGIIN
jgi:23S rRNA (guanosine2251-2'-O)-methyltransferase